MDQALQQVTISELQNLRLVTDFHLIAAVLLIYDYTLTLVAEARLIWPSPMNLGKILYILTRALPFLDMPVSLSHEFIFNPSSRTCFLLYRFTAWSFLVGVAVADTILIIRTSALWGNDIRIKYFLSALFVVIFCPMAVTVNLALNVFDYTSFPSPQVLPGCFVVTSRPSGTNWYGVYYGLLPIFETTVFVLTIVQFRAVKSYRNQPSVFVRTLYRDGVLFYFYLLVISITYLIVLLRAPKELANLLFSFHRVIHSLLSSRLLLNLREATIRNVEGTGVVTNMFASRYLDQLGTIRFINEHNPDTLNSDETELSEMSLFSGGGFYSSMQTSMDTESRK